MQQSIYYIKFAREPIMIRLSLTSFNGVELTPHVYVMGMLSASPTLSRMI